MDSDVDSHRDLLEEAESRIESQHYVEWREEQEIALPGVFPTHPIWWLQAGPFTAVAHFTESKPDSTICLEVIEDKADISGLPCLHVFYEACIDRWFELWHYDCPLCKREVFDQSPACFRAYVEQTIPTLSMA
jgi:hypothetical protein